MPVTELSDNPTADYLDTSENTVLSSSSEEGSTEGRIQSRREVLAQMRENEQQRAKNNEIRETIRMNWEQLKSARHERSVLTSRIISVETVNDMIVVCVVMIKGMRAIIPCEEMYISPPIDMSTVRTDVDRVRRERQILSKLLGAEIPFIITNIEGSPEDDAYAIVASRKEALRRIAAQNFNRRGANGPAYTNEGDIVEAAIISVGRHAVWANVRGIDISIPVYRLTHKYVANAIDVYHPGEKLNVYINEIRYDERGHVTEITVSGREPEMQEYITKLKGINPGSIYLARITSIRRSVRDASKTVISLFLEDIGLPGIANYTRIDTLPNPPKTGDVVVFSTYSVNEERGVVVGSILRRV